MVLKKHFGQHFLKSEQQALFISQQANQWGVSYDTLLEIGPGGGALTKHLAPMASESKKLILIEVDGDLIESLKKQYENDFVSVLHIDFLKYDLSLISSNFGVIGNFPYNISSQIVFKVLEQRTKVVEMIGMFQKEVSQRIASKHGSKVYGILSVLVQAYYEVEALMTLKPGAFNPPPKVDSQVIRLNRMRSTIDEVDELLLYKIVKASFGQRRKTLRNSLRAFVDKIETNDQLVETLKMRPEQLSVFEFIELTKQLQS